MPHSAVDPGAPHLLVVVFAYLGLTRIQWFSQRLLALLLARDAGSGRLLSVGVVIRFHRLIILRVSV
jgi:hypothetical protein